MKHTTIISIALITLAVNVFAQPPDTLWTRTIGSGGWESGHCVRQTLDGGYIITGNHSYGTSSNAWLVKTDAYGDTIWTRTFGGYTTENGLSVQQTSDEGYIIAGYTRSYGAGFNDVYLVKTDANGDTIWTRAYGGRDEDQGYSVQQTFDGGYIVVGLTYSFGAGENDVYLIKTNANGDTIWTRTYGGSSYDAGLCVQQTPDSGYVICGHTNFDVYLLRTDAFGNTLWSRTYGGNGGDYGESLDQTTDGGFIIAGHSGSYSNNWSDVYLLKTDSLGNQQWYRIFSASQYDNRGEEVQQTSDGGYIIAGYTFRGDHSDLYVIKTDSSGYAEWTQTIVDSASGSSVQQTFDNGYIICGAVSAGGSADVLLIRLEGELVLTLTPSPSLVIPASGGSFDFEALAANGTPNPLAFDAWSEVTLPNGRAYGPLIMRRGLNLPSQNFFTRRITQVVPGNAPAGNYRYIGNVGVYPDSVWDSDEFEFVKRP